LLSWFVVGALLSLECHLKHPHDCGVTLHIVVRLQAVRPAIDVDYSLSDCFNELESVKGAHQIVGSAPTAQKRTAAGSQTEQGCPSLFRAIEHRVQCFSSERMSKAPWMI
jgi:hypothetical protein